MHRSPGPVRAKLRSLIATAAPRRLGPVLYRAGLAYRGLVVAQRSREGTWDVRTVYYP
jgi:hypothetical protein